MISNHKLTFQAVYFLTFFLISFSIGAIDIAVTNVQENPNQNCGTVLIDLEVSNAVMDDPIPGIPLEGDFVNLIIRDGDCNIIGFSFFTLTDGNDQIEIPLLFTCENGLYCPPTSRPMTYSFHDNGNQLGVEMLETVPPVTSFVFDPMLNCNNLPVVTEPECPFAIAPIPTLGTWSLILLSLFLLILGIINLQSKKVFRFNKT